MSIHFVAKWLGMRRIVLAILVVGLSGIVAQILLLRELLIIFCSNELSLGIILANWLMLEVIGCFFLGKVIERINRRVEAFVGLCLIFSLFLPSTIYLVRILREMLGVIPGEGLGLVSIVLSSFFILIGVSIPHGALFTFSCKIHSLSEPQSHPKKGSLAIGQVYIYETLGTILGGIVSTYLLIPYFNSLQIALGISILNIILSLSLLGPFWRKAQPLMAKILGGISIVALVLGGILILGGKIERIHWSSVRSQWRGQDVLYYRNSLYGNVAVVKMGEQFTFFSNGVPIVTTLTPDISFVEEFVHLSLLSHPHPREILILSGGAGGIIHEALKHSPRKIDYIELDPLILKAIKEFSTPLTEKELGDPRVGIEYLDGRLFVKETSCGYDLILIGLSNPSDLQTNRLFTKEFFSLVKRRLKEEGILVVSLPGSLVYLNEELKSLNACILNTLKRVYSHIKIIPGDTTNLFLASSSKVVSLVDANLLCERLKGRHLKTNLLTPQYIEYKLDPRWLDWFLNSLEGSTEKINQDFKPLGVFYSLNYWNALFSPYLCSIFNWFEGLDLKSFLGIFFVFTLLFLILKYKTGRLSKAVIPLCITTTGFAGMVFELGLIFAFQALYGYVFGWIGLLVSFFMVGSAGGSLWTIRRLRGIRKDLLSFVGLELALITFSSVLPFILIILSPYLGTTLLELLFLFLSFFSGFLVGAQFPLANKIYLERFRHSLSGTAGLLYGGDLLGGWIGGIMGGVMLLPILGFLGTCLVVMGLKISSLIILLFSLKGWQERQNSS